MLATAELSLSHSHIYTDSKIKRARTMSMRRQAQGSSTQAEQVYIAPVDVLAVVIALLLQSLLQRRIPINWRDLDWQGQL